MHSVKLGLKFVLLNLKQFQSDFSIFRYFWKIVDDQNGHYISFIGVNYPFDFATALARRAFEDAACNNPINMNADFGVVAPGNNYVPVGVFHAQGHIFACLLVDVRLPEMQDVRDTVIGPLAGGYPKLNAP